MVMNHTSKRTTRARTRGVTWRKWVGRRGRSQWYVFSGRQNQRGKKRAFYEQGLRERGGG